MHIAAPAAIVAAAAVAVAAAAAAATAAAAAAAPLVKSASPYCHQCPWLYDPLTWQSLNATRCSKVGNVAPSG